MNRLPLKQVPYERRPMSAAVAEPADSAAREAVWDERCEQFFREVTDWAQADPEKLRGVKRYSEDGQQMLAVRFPRGILVFRPLPPARGGDGLIDIFVLSSLDSVMLSEEGSGWRWHDPGEPEDVEAVSRPWDRNAFERVADLLLSRADAA